MRSPFDKFIEHQSFCVLDGGLASELEYLGHDLRHPLWSAKVMLSDAEVIEHVHLQYLNAGADCITTASYQVSYPGCRQLNMTKEETSELLRLTVEVATSARIDFMRTIDPHSDRLKPLIAASIGPYGAYLADGSEYTGNYGCTDSEIYDFHAPRLEVFEHEDVDLLACETVPSYREAKVLMDIIQKTSDKPAFISFSCKDGLHISDGTPVRNCTELFPKDDPSIGIGINCTNPVFVSSLIEEIKAVNEMSQTIVYPNSGEVYNTGLRSWEKSRDLPSLHQFAQYWMSKGVRVIGGCCRTRPDHIRQLRQSLMRHWNQD